MVDSDVYTIFCAIQGKRGCFAVEILRDETVYHLKKAIKTERAIALESFDPSELDLCQVNVTAPTEAQREDALAQADISNILDPLSKIKDIYSSTPPEGTIHILVQLPELGE